MSHERHAANLSGVSDCDPVAVAALDIERQDYASKKAAKDESN